MLTEGDVTLCGNHTTQYTNDISYNCTHETYVILLTGVTPINNKIWSPLGVAKFSWALWDSRIGGGGSYMFLGFSGGSAGSVKHAVWKLRWTSWKSDETRLLQLLKGHLQIVPTFFLTFLEKPKTPLFSFSFIIPRFCNIWQDSLLMSITCYHFGPRL